jgi:hypothetical protein
MPANTSEAVRVDGLSRVRRALEQAGVEAGELKSTMQGIGQTVARAAKPRTPVRTGALEGSIRAGKAKTKATVRAGGARVPYAGVVHYGWPAHNIEAQPFLIEALEAERTTVFRDLDQAITALLRREHLI